MGQRFVPAPCVPLRKFSVRAHFVFHCAEPRAATHFRSMALQRHGATASVHACSLQGTTARDAKSAWRKSLLHRKAMEPETSGTRRLERRIFNSDSLATST